MALGFSQTTLSRLLRWDPSTISHYERGHYNQGMSFARLRQMARTLATTTDYLLGLSNDPGPVPEDGEESSLDGATPRPTTTTRERSYAKYTNRRP